MYSFGRAKILALVTTVVITSFLGVALLIGKDAFLGISLANALDPTLEGPQIDSDNDGLSDGEEVKLGTNPYLSDTDNDGYTDKEEVDTKHDPLHVDSNLLLDQDNDGLTGKDELTFGTSLVEPDTDFDGTPDGVEVVQGTDPGKAKIMSLPGYLGANVAEQRDKTMYPPIHPDELQKIEDLANAQSVEEFQKGLMPLFGEMPEANTTIPHARDVTIKRSGRSDKASIRAYFNTVGVVLAKYAPAQDMSAFIVLTQSTDVRSKETRVDIVRRARNLLKEFKEIEVPEDEEIIQLHTETLQTLMAAEDLSGKFERVDLTNTATLQEVLALMQSVQQLKGKLETDILPRVQSVADKHGFEIPQTLGAFIR